ncbi:uncharacterized protein LOC133732622 [Rosa rugosa]|uniref:uncharacterized protein LOC133732622 n=1 Tax=Rosa rugosa TaxID=74645 RepID=UPI002B403387|nr:uncharacterized protein LOC133732622 [Rosa rugosa]XP_062016191.1 uncharacterized protein LOC133732622 [Rosa rugosa]
MSILPNSPWRGCAANYPQPVNEVVELAAQFLVETVYYFNCRIANLPLADIEYRSSSGEEDILRHVFRWDLTPYQEVFQNGFEARRQENTTDQVYYNLDDYVHHGGRPLDSRRPATHAFVSTTLNSGWHPTVTETVEEVYRYEIYAPGGILVAETLGDRYQYPAQDEVSFVAGIAPQYIRSVQRFRLVRNGRYTRRERLDEEMILNGNYNPQSHPYRALDIRRPVLDYVAEDGKRQHLNFRIWEGPAIDNSDATDWYAGGVANYESYIDAAFRSSRENEAYLFMKNEYVLIDYAPATTNDKVLKGPLLICDGFPSLTGTAFAEHGIDCAFASHNGNEAFIFSGNLCALIDYAPDTKNDKIIKGPMTIRAMFPFFKGTVFESGIDAAFESTRKYEAYLFKDNQYARINYGSDSTTLGNIITSNVTAVNFPSLKNTIFESGIDAAFASHKTDQAYLFKGDTYTRINFAPGTTGDYIIGGVKTILPNWPSLQPYLPCKNRGLDVHNHTSPSVDDDDRDQDQL